MDKKAFGTAIPRLQKDYMKLNKDPVPYIRAEPLPSDMLEWHYVIKGPEDTPYFGGYYHGTLIFTQQYPFKPPSIYMSTPNGRFEVNRRLCLSISDYHPDEWNPAWCVSSILTGLLSFMLESTQALGTIETTTNAKLNFARKSLAFNVNREEFCTLFPDITEEINEKLAKMTDEEKSTSTPVSTTKKFGLTEDSLGENNIVFIISACIMALICYHVYRIMGAD